MSFWSNAKINCGLSADPSWRRCVATWAGVSLFLIAVAAYFSYGYYHLDEYYQIIEFTSFKLGKTPAAELAWEYHRLSRPWMQPAIYFVPPGRKPQCTVGIENPFKLGQYFFVRSMVCAAGPWSFR